jgi:hypothetical protein
MPVEKRPDHDLEPRHGRRHNGGMNPNDFFGLDVDKMSPRAQVATGLAVLVPVAVGAAFVFYFVPWLWWLIFVFGWSIFPAFGLLVRGIAGLSDDSAAKLPAADTGERELLEALQRRGELTPAQAAMETSLTVNEADKMLEGLAAKGHLDVRVRGGGLFYRLWENEGGRAELGEGG